MPPQALHSIFRTRVDLVRALHLLILTSERAWAHAMAMKAAHSEDNADKNITGSTRQHIVSRLHKAVQNARHIVELLSDSASHASETDVLEAKAYAFALAGAEEFEKQAEGVKSSNASPQRWNSCLTNLAAARIIYSALLKTTKQDLFKDVLAGTTDPSIRYAAYQSRIPRTVGVPAVAIKFFPQDDVQLREAVERLDQSALQEEDAASSREWHFEPLLRPISLTIMQILKSPGVAAQPMWSMPLLDKLWPLSILHRLP